MVGVICGRRLLASFSGSYVLRRNLIHVAAPFIYLLLAGSICSVIHVETDS